LFLQPICYFYYTIILLQKQEEDIKMLRKIIKIDEEKCNGCSLCADACHEGAIGMIDGKAKLLREDYCDGLGDCLPVCPTGAITFEEREAAAFNEEEVNKNTQAEVLPCGCPGTHVHEINRGSAVSDKGNVPDSS